MDTLGPNEIQLESADRDGSRIEININVGSEIDPFFEETTFWAEYDADLSSVPEGILMIPAVANIAPLVWALDGRLYVDTLDTTFADTLSEVQCTLADFYPEIGFNGGELVIANRTREKDPQTTDAACLFSGGVDSIATHVRHLDRSPCLISIHGADVRPENVDGWNRVKQDIERYCNRHDASYSVAQSNFRSQFDGVLLMAEFGKDIVANWWGGVQHGLGLTGLCAPFCYSQGIEELLIASTHTEGFDQPWGSHPDIDNRITWSGTSVSHDGYELTRQDKVELIADHAQAEDKNIHIRSCYRSEAGDNCSRCEKCCRTIVGLEIAGVDPRKYGFDVSDETFTHIQKSLENGDWSIGYDEVFMWENLQQQASEVTNFPDSGMETFANWLEHQEFSQIRKRASASHLYEDRLLFLVRLAPNPIYKRLRTFV
ncbi:hypothetical protein ACOZ32_00470 [Halobacterium sp. MBLA0001]|uniref:hypothetical protein n=1 Tax=Halobacterium sp. MBLA0001 TaxID=3413511 RepID=UPI003C72B9FE